MHMNSRISGMLNVHRDVSRDVSAESALCIAAAAELVNRNVTVRVGLHISNTIEGWMPKLGKDEQP